MAAAVLKFRLNEDSGSIKITEGVLFLGSAYTFELFDKSDAPVSGCTLYLYLDDHCVAKSIGSTLGLNTSFMPDRARECECDLGLKLLCVRGESILADGMEVMRWTPVLTVADGKAIDTKGDKGDRGDKGDKGDRGGDGRNGTNGIDGKNGVDGTNGVDGVPGLTGAKGKQGEKGGTGATGSKGEQGERGVQGVKGDTGVTGGRGAKGDKGDSVQGGRGERGLTGQQGEKGVKGEKGDPFTLPSDYPEIANGSNLGVTRTAFNNLIKKLKGFIS